jgi:deoxyadenosine/deoxycytidine kinase
MPYAEVWTGGPQTRDMFLQMGTNALSEPATEEKTIIDRYIYFPADFEAVSKRIAKLGIEVKRDKLKQVIIAARERFIREAEEYCEKCEHLVYETDKFLTIGILSTCPFYKLNLKLQQNNHTKENGK